MNIELFREYCLSLPQVEEGMPFDQSILVFTVKGKIFCLTDIDAFNFVNLKCDPDLAIQLREQYSAVTPGYHMNKKHWNSIAIDAGLSDHLIFEWVKHSYQQVILGLPKKVQLELKQDGVE